MQDFFHSIIALIIVIPLIVLTIYLMKRFSAIPLKKGSSLKVIEQVSLGTKHHIAVVETEEVRMVVGLSANDIKLLHQTEKKTSS